MDWIKHHGKRVSFDWWLEHVFRAMLVCDHAPAKARAKARKRARENRKRAALRGSK